MTPKHPLAFLVLSLALLLMGTASWAATTATILGWNNLGMHCMDSRYAEFSILPPYNSFDAQLIVNGKLIADPTSAGNYSITYEAIPDPAHTQAPIPWMNSTSANKSDFWSFANVLGLTNSSLATDAGLAGCNMPGLLNPAQPMRYESSGSPLKTYHAEGVPITPYNDDGVKNTYPMVRIKAWTKGTTPTVIAQTDIVLPVSDEMTCKSCHAPNTNPLAMPTEGWITHADPDREYRLNILKLHDQKQAASALYADALTAMGRLGGLYANATATPPKPALCAGCHGSNALGTTSFTSGNGTVSNLTQAIHGLHAKVTLPNDPKALDDSTHRDACYTCHPGSATKCLRGAMGSAVATDGSMAMQCQSCHGKMSDVGSTARTGWLDEPTCQNCHTGTATSNNGQIRYLSVFEAAPANTTPVTTLGNPRAAVNQTFATNADTPLAGKSLYRFSKGHGELQCSACHGSTHAEFPSAHASDNRRNIAIQGHVGMNVECKTCHASNWSPSTPLGGPHGMHTVDQNWVNSHHDAVSQTGLAACQSCHGADNRGTVLSRVQGNRSFNDKFSQKFYRGATVGCYSCHNGPNSSNTNSSVAPTTASVNGTTLNANALDVVLPGNATGVTLRILTQPEHGTVGLLNGIATYFPDTGYVGADSFTFAGYDGSKNSYDVSNPNLPGFIASTANLTVTGGAAAPAPSTVAFTMTQNDATPGSVIRTGDVLKMTATATNATRYEWFKDGWLVGSGNPYVINSASQTDNGRYVVLAHNDNGATASQSALVLNVLTPPLITTQPLSQTVNSGVAVSLSVVATGTGPLTYQWFKNNVAISGKTSATLSLSAVTLAAAGNYTVKVTNAAGTVTSSVAVLTVNEAPKITTQPASQTVNQGATVNLNVVATGNPVVSYQWYKNGTPVGTNAATLTLNSVQISDAGAYTVTITNTLGSVTSNAANVTVKALTSATLVSSLNPAAKGTAVTLTVTVSGNNPSGTVTFKDGTTTLGTATLTAATASLTTTTLAAGARTITVSYPGDALNQATTATLVQNIVAQTTTTVATSKASVAYGTAVTFTATIAGGTTPTGSVDFKVDGTSIGMAAVSGTKATLTTATPLAVGSHSVVAVYGGNANNAGSTSATITQTVTKLSPKTAVTSSAATVKTGSSVTLTATLTGGVGPTGTITFNDKLGTVTTVLGAIPVSAGKAAVTVTTLAKGKHSITAVYSGDGNHNTSTSSAFTQTMN